MLKARTMLLGLPALVICAIAGQVIFSWSVNGAWVEARFIAQGSNTTLSVEPAKNDTASYQVFWQVCTPMGDHTHCVSAGVLIPRSDIKVEQIVEAGLDIDTSLYTVFTPPPMAYDCPLAGPCSLPYGAAAPLVKGRFTVVRGPGWSVEESNGSIRRDVDMGGGTSSTTFSGNRTMYSTNFVGSIGELLVTRPEIGCNAQLSIMKGQSTSQLVYPPV